GTDETGMGFIEPSPPAVQEETSPPLPSDTAVNSKEEPLLTQNTEEAPVVKKVDPEVEKKRLEKIEADKKTRDSLEADQLKKTAITNRTKNALANSKNAGTTSTSEGVAGGDGNQGVPTGSVDSQTRGDGSGLGNKGVSYDLQGRGVTKLTEPKYNYQEEGKVVVEISVDRDGKVTQAVFRVKGSTTLDESLIRIAREAALATTFDPDQNAPLFQKGSIIYTFKLN
ncbi:MAG: hypothetical protein NT092_08900, partial [Bacteroidia bacterium]|nr:hypothetical protein [Bacteroidia bacterium]